MISKRHRYDPGQFAVLPKVVVNNAGLTFEARGLLLYLLEKPADWRVSNEHLYNQSPGGERHVNTILKELKTAGYVHREKVYDPPTRTFRWDTTVYDFPEDNPHFNPTGIPTFRTPTKRTPTKRKPTKRSDDLILDPPIPNELILEETKGGEAAAPVVEAPPSPPEPAYEPEHPTELLLQMAATPTVQEPAARPEKPGGALPRVAPLAANEDEFQAATRAYETAARAARLARMAPDERRRVEATERMVEMLARVTDTTVKANRGRLESVAAKVNEFTPEQIWRGFGDPAGWWWQEWYKGKKQGQKPTLYDVQEFAGRAVAWQPRPGGSNAVTAQAETAWAAVQRAISSFGRYRQGELLAALDEVARLAVKAVGLNQLLDLNPEDRYAANKVMRDFKQEYAAAAARLGGRMQTAD